MKFPFTAVKKRRRSKRMMDRDVLGQLLVRPPLVVEPLPLEVGSAAQMSRSIGIKVQVMGICCISVDKEGAAIPVWKEGLPPVDVCPGLRVQANVVMELLG